MLLLSIGLLDFFVSELFKRNRSSICYRLNTHIVQSFRYNEFVIFDQKFTINAIKKLCAYGQKEENNYSDERENNKLIIKIPLKHIFFISDFGSRIAPLGLNYRRLFVGLFQRLSVVRCNESMYFHDIRYSFILAYD